MFDINRLTTPIGFDVAETEMLNGFAKDLTDRLKAHTSALDQCLNGELLLNRERLNRLEDIALETRHLEYIWNNVSRFWADRTPGFGKRWNSQVDEAFAAIATRIATVKEIAKA